MQMCDNNVWKISGPSGEATLIIAHENSGRFTANEYTEYNEF